MVEASDTLREAQRSLLCGDASMEEIDIGWKSTSSHLGVPVIWVNHIRTLPNGESRTANSSGETCVSRPYRRWKIPLYLCPRILRRPSNPRLPIRTIPSARFNPDTHRAFTSPETTFLERDPVERTRRVDQPPFGTGTGQGSGVQAFTRKDVHTRVHVDARDVPTVQSAQRDARVDDRD